MAAYSSYESLADIFRWYFLPSKSLKAKVALPLAAPQHLSCLGYSWTQYSMPSLSAAWDSPSSDAWPCSILRYTFYRRNCTRMDAGPRAYGCAHRSWNECCTSYRSLHMCIRTCKRSGEFSRGLSRSNAVWTLRSTLDMSKRTFCSFPFHEWSSGKTNAKASWSSWCNLQKYIYGTGLSGDFLNVISTLRFFENAFSSSKPGI